VTAIVSDWLSAEGFVDDGVRVAEVRFHDSELLSTYLRIVKKRAITFGGHVWFRDAALADQAVQANWPLYVHELVHVGQYRERGLLRFLAAYLWHFAKAGFRYSRRLPLEAPAYERQREAERRLGLR
jgi:hypothetical protein